MSLSKSFIRHLYSLVADGLAAEGFDARTKGIFTVELEPGVFGWLGLNKALRAVPGALALYPIAGVRHQELESLVARLHGEKPHAYIPPSASSPVGYLMPGEPYRLWAFHEDREIESGVDDMVAAIREHAYPFMRANADLAVLYATIRDRRLGHYWQERLPAACLLLGRTVEAEAFLRHTLSEMRDRTDGAAERYRRFAGRLQYELRKLPS